MTNKGKTYKRRGGRPPRLRVALELAWDGYKRRKKLTQADEWFIEATLLAAQQHQARHQARQGHALEAPVTGGTVTRD